jgi:hypothetical protein
VIKFRPLTIVDPYKRKAFNQRPPEEYIIPNYPSPYAKKLILNNPKQITTESTYQLSQVETKPEILSAEKLKSRVLSSQNLSLQPLSQRIPYSDQEKEKLKKLIDDIWDYRNHRITLEQMNEKGYDSDSVFVVNAIYTALQNLADRSKFQEKYKHY